MKINKKLTLKAIACTSLLFGTILSTTLIVTSCSNTSQNDSSVPPTVPGGRVFKEGTYFDAINELGVTPQTIPDEFLYSLDGGKTFNRNDGSTGAIDLINKTEAKINDLKQLIETELVNNPNANPDFTEINKLSELYQNVLHYKSINKYWISYSIYTKEILVTKNEKIMFLITDKL